MRLKLLNWSTLILACLLVLPSFAAEEETSESKAATEIIESLQAAVGNLSEFKKLPPSQRIQWVKEKSASYVQAKVLSTTKDTLTKAMADYAAAAFRAKAFESIALPALKNNIVAGLPLDWASVESKMLQQVDTRTRAYGVAAQGVSIVWDSIEAFDESGANAGFSKIGAGILEAVADAYIPGWGWFKLGASVVEGVGKYVLAYATDTAIDGMLNDMFGMKSNPEEFARMLQTTVPAQLTAKIEDGWELVSNGRLWEGQGTDAGEAAMKQKIKDRLMDMKVQVAAAYAAKKKKDDELRAKTKPYLDAARQAEDRIKSISRSAKEQARPMLDIIQTFNRQRNAKAEEQAQADATLYQAQAVTGSEDLITYLPIDRSGIYAAYNLAFDLCQEKSESFSGMDYWAHLTEADQIRAQVVNSQPTPPVNTPGMNIWWIRQGADRTALSQEIEAMRLQAMQRIGKQDENMQNTMNSWASQIRSAAAQLEDGLLSLDNRVKEEFLLPTIYRRHFVPILTAYAPTNHTDQWLNGGGLAGGYEEIKARLGKLETDRSAFIEVDALRKSLYSQYQSTLLQADAALRAVVPNGCQDFRVSTNSVGIIELRWAVTNFLLTLDTSTSVYATRIDTPCVNNTFNIDAAQTQLQARLSELQEGYDTQILTSQVRKIAEVAAGKLSPFLPASPSAYDYAVSIMGRVNDLLDYHYPLESTDLVKLTSQLEETWGTVQTRLALLQRHQAYVDPGTLASLQSYGTILTNYQKVITNDRNARASAPATAANILKSYQSILNRWPAAPLWWWTHLEYEETLGGMAGNLANAQKDLRRGQTGGSPIYALLQKDMASYVQQAAELLRKHQADYAQNASTFMKTMPKLSLESTNVSRTVGQAISLTVSATEPGGTFSSPYLPPGLSVNPATGVIAGVPTAAGWAGDAVIAYVSPAGVTARSLIRFEIKAPEVGRIAMALEGGNPTLRFSGQAGSGLRIQAKPLDKEHWWKTVGTVTLTGAEQSWRHGSTESLLIYRTVFVP
jgi:hypothetical protein